MMSVWARANPSDDELTQLQNLDSTNPFACVGYARARRALGARVVLFAEGEPGAVRGGTLGYLEGGAFGRWLEIPSAYAPLNPSEFWEVVRGICRRRRVVRVEVGSFGARNLTLPEWSVPTVVSARTEWLIQLDDPTGVASLAANHRRNIAKARAAGVTIRVVSDPAVAHVHAQLMGSSMQRRSERGEQVPEITAADTRTTAAYLASGIGRLYQALAGEEVMSSLLLLEAPSGAYYHSAGTTAAGMDVGASTLLVSEIIARLRASGLAVLNLGGAGDDSPGLQRFKKGFGAKPVALTAGEYVVASRAERRIRSIARILRDPSRLRRALLHVDKYAVFSAAPGEIQTSVGDDVQLIKLDDEALREISKAEPEFVDQIERVERLRYNGAYGLKRGAELLHVAWLVDAENDARTPERNVKLRTGEAEITHCYTPAKSRGKGAYGTAIAALASIAGDRNVSRLYMITNVSNLASRRGIEKAGFRRVGHIWRIFLVADRLTMTIRGHRWPWSGRGAYSARPQ